MISKIISKIKKKNIAVLSASLAVIIFITAYIVFFNPYLNGLQGAAIHTPASEEYIRYGDIIQLRCESFNNFISARGSTDMSDVNLQVNSKDLEHWKIIKKDYPNSTDIIKFGDKLFLQSVTHGNYLSSRSNNDVKVMKSPLQDEVWQIINTFDTSIDEEVCLFDPVLFKSNTYNNYLSAHGYGPDSDINLVGSYGEWEKWVIQPKNYYKNWMSFSTKIHDKYLKEITFPAAHDAAAYGFQNTFASEKETEDLRTWLGRLNTYLDPLQNFDILEIPLSLPTAFINNEKKSAESILYNMSKELSTATDFTIDEQLNRGVRWFDLRINLRNDGAYAFHALVAQKMDGILDQVKNYLDSTSGEIVVLEMSHFVDDGGSYDTFLQKVNDKFGSYVYKKELNDGKAVNNPMNKKYSEVIVGGKSRVILLMDSYKEKNATNHQSFWTYEQLGLNTGSYDYSNTTSRDKLISDQLTKYKKAKAAGEPFTMWYTLTASPDEYIAIVTNKIINDLCANFTTRIMDIIPDWAYKVYDIRKTVRNFLKDNIFKFNVLSNPDFNSLKELTKRVDVDTKLVFEKNFQSLFNPYGYNAITVLYTDYFYTNTDIIDIAIAYSRLPSKDVQKPNLYPEAKDIQSGGLYYIKNKHTGKYLDVFQSKDANGTQVWQYPGNETKAQQWRVTYNANGLYTFESIAVPDRVLDIYSADSARYGKVDVWTDNGSPGMLFALEPSVDGKAYRLRTACSNFTLMIVADAQGKNIQDGSSVMQLPYVEDSVYIEEWFLEPIKVTPTDGKYIERTDIVDGAVYYIKNRYSGKLLDIENGKNENSALVMQWGNYSSNSQKWKVVYAGDGLYEFVSFYGSSSRILDVYPSGNQEGGAIDIWRNNRSPSSRFALELTADGKAYIIRSQCSGFTKALSVNGASQNNAARVIQYTYVADSITNDEWTFELVPGFQPKYEEVPGIVDGGIYYLKNVYKEQYLDVAYGSDFNGNNVWMYQYNGSKAQQWKIIYTGNGLYKLQSLIGSSKRVLAISQQNNLLNDAITFGTYDDDDSPGMHFALVPNTEVKSFKLLTQCSDFHKGLYARYVVGGGGYYTSIVQRLQYDSQMEWILEPVSTP